MDKIIPYIHKFPFLVVLVSFAIGYFFMPVVIRIAKNYNFVVSPNKRTSHSGEIPNVGGVNIFVSFLITVFLFSFEVFYSVQFTLLGLFIILIVGFIDDLINIKVSSKLFGEPATISVTRATLPSDFIKPPPGYFLKANKMLIMCQ